MQGACSHRNAGYESVSKVASCFPRRLTRSTKSPIYQTYPFFIGIDVSKDPLDVALLTPQCQVLTQARLDNTPAAIKQWVKGLSQQFAAFSLPTCLVCLEHTSLYCRPVLTGLSALRAAVWLEHAAQMKVSMGQVRGKTDAADAVCIGQYRRALPGPGAPLATLPAGARGPGPAHDPAGAAGGAYFSNCKPRSVAARASSPRPNNVQRNKPWPPRSKP